MAFPRIALLWPLATVLTTLIPASASADPRCEVRLEGGISGEWSSAVRSVDRTLGHGAADCREIVVTPDLRGATVVFTTREGRMAQRRIERPSDLLPLIDALLVTVPFSAGPELSPAPLTLPTPATGEVATERSAVLSPLEPPMPKTNARVGANPPSPEFSITLPRQLEGLPDRDVAEKPREPDVAKVLLGLGAGLRGAFPGVSVAPTGQVMVGFALTRWEFGLLGRWEFEHDMGTEATVGHVHASAIGGGAVVGRRDRVGPFLFVYGTSLEVFAAQEEYGERSTDGASHVSLSDSFADPRAGLYLGCVLPRNARFRLRVQLDGEMAINQHVPSSSELPMFPKWSAGLTIGAETAFLP